MLRQENLEYFELKWSSSYETCFGRVQKQEGLNKTLKGGRFHSLESTAIKFLGFFAKVKSDGGKHDFLGRKEENFQQNLYA